MPAYIYSPIDSQGSEFRVLSILCDVKDHLSIPKETPLQGRLANYHLASVDLPFHTRVRRNLKIPTYTALSYVWGNPARTHEILIDGKSVPITTNLYAALRQIRSERPWEFHIWVDAVCIDQSNQAERSAQIRLMRQVYSRAMDVVVWLGPGSSDSIKSMQFIAQLLGYWATNTNKTLQDSAVDGRSESSPADTALEEFLMKGVVKTSGAFAHGLMGFVSVAQGLALGVRDEENIFKDGKAEPVLSSDERLSLARDAVTKYAEWRPKKKNLEKAQADWDFKEAACLIGKSIINDTEWFKRMWVLQEVGVSQSVHIQLGPYFMEWELFLRATHYLNYTCNAPIDGIRQVTALERIRMAWRTGKRHPLGSLIRESRYRLATDPKDKIYALLGLMGDGMNDLL
jgi:hypothetical protein